MEKAYRFILRAPETLRLRINIFQEHAVIQPAPEKNENERGEEGEGKSSHDLHRRARLVERAHDCACDPELEQVTDDPAAEDFRRQRLHRECDQVVADIQARHQDSQYNARGCAAGWDEAGVEQSEKERHHDMPQNQPRKVTAKVRFGPPKHRDFIMDVLHELPVPEKSRQEDENERDNKCDEESFRVHKF